MVDLVRLLGIGWVTLPVGLSDLSFYLVPPCFRRLARTRPHTWNAPLHLEAKKKDEEKPEREETTERSISPFSRPWAVSRNGRSFVHFVWSSPARGSVEPVARRSGVRW